MLTGEIPFSASWGEQGQELRDSGVEETRDGNVPDTSCSSCTRDGMYLTRLVPVAFKEGSVWIGIGCHMWMQ
jgi:hypothetical protein